MYKKLIWTLLLCLPLTLSAQEVLTEETQTEGVQPDTVSVEKAPTNGPTIVRAATKSEQQAAAPKFGYLSYSEVICLMPDYAASQEELGKLQARYDKELERSEKEFNRKFSDFLEEKDSFDREIMTKRQKELISLVESGISFKQEVAELLEAARKDLTEPLIARLNEVIAEVGMEYNLEYVLNTDHNACPFINPSVGMDITDLVKAKLEIDQ